jgi:hypothetical protein
VLRIDPRHAAARASAGYARVMDLMAGRETARSESVLIASARDDFEQALKLGLDTPELRFDLACCRLWVGDISPAAIETLRNLRRELAPQGSKRDVYLATLTELARIEYLDSGRRIPDTSYCEEATKQAPDRGDIAELAAATMLRRADLEANLQNSAAASATFDRAAEYFGRAVELGVATDKLAALRSLNPRTAGDSRFAIPTVDRSAVATSPPQQWFFDPVESLSRRKGIEQSR